MFGPNGVRFHKPDEQFMTVGFQHFNQILVLVIISMASHMQVCSICDMSFYA